MGKESPLPFCLQTSELEWPLGGQPVQSPAFTTRETEAKKGEGACPRSHSKEREKKACSGVSSQPLSLEPRRPDLVSSAPPVQASIVSMA